MSLKDELTAIKDVRDYEEKYKSNEYLTAVAKTWVDNWVEEVLKKVETAIKNKVKNGEYKQCGNHNIVHNTITLYDEDFGRIDAFYNSIRDYNLFGVLDKDNFTANKEFINYLDRNFDCEISNNGIKFLDGKVRAMWDEYGGRNIYYTYSPDERGGICLFLTQGRGIKYTDCKEELANASNRSSFMDFFKPKKEPEKTYVNYYKTLKLGDIGQYAIDCFTSRAPEYGFEVDIYVEREIRNYNNTVKKERYEFKDLISEVNFGRFESNYQNVDLYLRIDFSTKF